jgi:cysteinyl-tRNA synthetase
MHNGYINIDNEKMSKSLGNFVLVHDIIKKHNPQVLRFFMLSVHYRNPINYSEELLESTKAAFERITTSYHNLKHRREASTDLSDTNQEWLEKIAKSQQEFIEAMDDDFNTAKAISVLFDLSKLANYYLLEKNTAVEVIDAFTRQFEELFHVLGLTFEKEEMLDEEIDALIEKRIQARKDRNFQLSDQIRDQLKDMNIILEDTPQGTRWKRG